MENAEIRQILEAEILKLGKTENPLPQSEFDRYCDCLLSLFSLDKITVFEQEKIYTAAYGDIGGFVLEFLKYVSPLIERRGKNLSFKTVLDRRTKILFSPRLTEIALGCMLSVFLSKNDNAYISIFNTKTYIAIRAKSKFIHEEKAPLHCIKKIAKLHSGRIICSFCSDCTQITLTFPLSPQFQPMRAIPCFPTLCRLCRI